MNQLVANLLASKEYRRNYGEYLAVHGRRLPRMVVKDLKKEKAKEALTEIFVAYEARAGKVLLVENEPIRFSRKEWFEVVAGKVPSGPPAELSRERREGEDPKAFEADSGE